MIPASTPLGARVARVFDGKTGTVEQVSTYDGRPLFGVRLDHDGAIWQGIDGAWFPLFSCGHVDMSGTVESTGCTHPDHRIDRTPVTYDVVGFDTFADAFTVAASARADIAASCSDPVDVAGTTFVLADDTRSGYAVSNDGELVHVFSTVHGRGAHMIQNAVCWHGAAYLDCFEGYLTTFYARHGFEAVASVPNWDADGADVVYMARIGHYFHALASAERAVASTPCDVRAAQPDFYASAHRDGCEHGAPTHTN